MPKEINVKAELSDGVIPCKVNFGQTLRVGTVKSVNGKTGDVELSAEDVGALPEGSLNGYATEEWVEGKGYITEHQDISGKADRVIITIDIDDDDGDTLVPSMGFYDVLEKIKDGDNVVIVNDDTAYPFVTVFLFDGKPTIIFGFSASYDGSYFTTGYGITQDDIAIKIDDGDRLATEDWVENMGYLTEHQDISGKADRSEIPTKTSDLINDSGFLSEHQSLDGYATESWVESKNYLTEHQDISGKADKSELPTSTSDLINDSGFITEHQSLDGYATEEWVEEKQYLTEHQDISGKADKSELPTKTSELVNDSGFITQHQSLDGYATEQWVDEQGYLKEHQSLSGLATQAWTEEKLGNKAGRYVVTIDTENGNYIPSMNFSDISSAVSHGDYVVVDDYDTTYPFLTQYILNGVYCFIFGISVAYQDHYETSGWAITINNTAIRVVSSGDLPSLDGYATQEWVEDKGYLTEHQSLENYATKTEVNEATNAVKSTIFYGSCDDTSTKTVFTAQIPGITEYFNGLTVLLHNGVVASASGFTININSLGAKPVYGSLAPSTRETTSFGVAYTFMLIYDESLNSGNGGWLFYKGSDKDTNTIGYQLRTNNTTLPMSSAVNRYRLLFTSADKEHYVPANNSASTNATAKRDTCQEKIDPFGAIRYYSSTTALTAGARPAITVVWDQYIVPIGYSFNRSNEAPTLTSWKPVYLKCLPQQDGTAIIDAEVPYVQDLPSTGDGYIYIFLGVAVSEISIELFINHPVYQYRNGAIRQYTETQDVTAASIQSALGYTPANPSDIPTQDDINTYVDETISTPTFYATDSMSKSVIQNAFGIDTTIIVPSNITNVLALVLILRPITWFVWLNGTEVEFARLGVSLNGATNAVTMYLRGRTSIAKGVMGVDSTWTVTQTSDFTNDYKSKIDALWNDYQSALIALDGGE